MVNFIEVIIPVLLLLILVVYTQRSSNDTEITLVRSSIDGKEYIVQNKPDKQQAADALARIRATLIQFVSKLKAQEPEDARVQRLVKKFDPETISEGTEDARYTTYTLNKGEKMVFCLRTRDNSDHVHRINLLLFVAIHELGHVCTLSEGHTDEFNTNFEYLTQKAVEYGIYKPDNFRANPETYCGIPVTDTPLSDDYFK